MTLVKYYLVPVIEDSELGGKIPDTADSQSAGSCASPVAIASIITTMPVDELAGTYGTHYFTIRTVDTDGLKSEWSNVVSGKLVGPPSAPVLLLIQ